MNTDDQTAPKSVFICIHLWFGLAWKNLTCSRNQARRRLTTNVGGIVKSGIGHLDSIRGLPPRL
jgi:hypothetical protein